MTPCTEAFAAILNIRNAAVDHKEHCSHNCNVSLMQLKSAALLLLPSVAPEERDEAQRYINEMPIT